MSNSFSVKLLSNDDSSFFVCREVALMSPVLADKLNQMSSEKVQMELPFRSEILEIIIDYLHFKRKYLYHEGTLPKFDFEESKVVDILKASLMLKI